MVFFQAMIETEVLSVPVVGEDSSYKGMLDITTLLSSFINSKHVYDPESAKAFVGSFLKTKVSELAGDDFTLFQAESKTKLSDLISHGKYP